MEEKKLAMIARIESALVRGAEDYFRKEKFVHVPTVPHIVNITGACENVDTLYGLDYHGKEAFLTQTGQTTLELLTGWLEKVCCVIHSFRSEEEVDGRHLTEFPLLEFEFKYEHNGFDELLRHIENTIYWMVQGVLKNEKRSLEELGVDIERLEKIKLPFSRVSYDKAVDWLGLEWGSDLKHAHEQKLAEHFGGPVFVTRYPAAIKFFNMMQNRENPLIVDSADLILPFSGEAVGSAVREHNYKILVERLRNSTMFKILSARGKTLDDFNSYLGAVKRNPVPHAGCGIGLCRVTQFVLGEDDIRKATPYPMNKESL